MFELDGAKVVVDAISLGLVHGSKVDYSTELIGSQFKIVDNPAASSNCGYVPQVNGG
jgi:iron-sulfur cluster assembly 2